MGYATDVDLDGLNDDGMAVRVLEAAHRFEMGSLVNLCAQMLKDNLTVENVSEILQVADSRGLAHLRQHCMDAIAANPGQIRKTDGFRQLALKYPELMLDVF